MIVAALVLTDQNNAVGKNHVILDYLPAYVRYFEDLTRGCPIIMGQRTFENIGHVLISRKNIVIARDEKYHSTRARTCRSLSDALEKCRKEKKIFVLGGTEIYRQAFPITEEIYRTCVMARFRSDNYYPEIDTEEFELASSECIKKDKENRFDYCVEKWVRIK
jgi:dihydrofolate reductase